MVVAVDRVLGGGTPNGVVRRRSRARLLPAENKELAEDLLRLPAPAWGAPFQPGASFTVVSSPAVPPDSMRYVPFEDTIRAAPEQQHSAR